MLTACINAINSITEATEKVVAQTPELDKSEATLRQNMRLINLLTMSVERFTGNASLNSLQQVLGLLVRIKLAADAVTTALIPGAGLFKILYAGANVVATSFMFYDTLQGT